MNDFKISPHFSFFEMTRTQHEDLQDANRQVSDIVMASLGALCTDILEPVRKHFGRPVRINSGYRSPALNKRIGGSKYSQHMKGQAADFTIPGIPEKDVWDWVRLQSGLNWGQVIWETPPGATPWIHISLGTPYRAATKSKQALVYLGSGNYVKHPSR